MSEATAARRSRTSGRPSSLRLRDSTLRSSLRFRHAGTIPWLELGIATTGERHGPCLLAIVTNGKLAQRQRWIVKELAEMPTAVLVLTILPEGEEKWRRFAQDLLGDHLGEYEGLGRRLGIRGLRVYLARTSRREMIVAYVEAGDPEEAFRRLVASEEPFAEWFKEKLAELHGYDLRWRMGPSPELIFEHPGDSGGP